MTFLSSTGTRRVVLAPSRADLIDGGFILILGVVALVGFRTTYSGTSYLAVGIAGLVLGLAVGHFANALRQPLITVAVMTVAVFFLLGGVVALRSSALGGVLPTGATVRGLASVTVHGWKELLTTLPPVPATGRLLVLPYVLGLMTGAGALTMAHRLRLAAAPLAGSVALLASVILLGTKQPPSQVLQGAGFGVLAIAWCGVRAARIRPPVINNAGRAGRLVTAAVLLGASGLAGALVGPHVPGGGHRRVVLRNYVTLPPDVNDSPSPLAGFRRYEVLQKDVPLFTVEGLHAGQPVRLATLDGYDGSVWSASVGTDPVAPRQPVDAFERVGSRLGSGSGGTTAITVHVAAAYAQAHDSDSWLPSAGTVESVTFHGSDAGALSDALRYNPGTNEAVVTQRLVTGDSYTMNVSLDETRITASSALGAVIPGGVPSIPDVETSVVGKLSATAVSAKGDVGASLATLADDMRQHGRFTDGQGIYARYLPGHSVQRLTDFVNGSPLVGDGEQYAAAFALAANSFGVPARVALVATPQGTVVSGKDVRADVELFVAPGHWIDVAQDVYLNDSPTNHPNPPTKPQQTVDPQAVVVPPPNQFHQPGTLDQTDQSSSANRSTPTSQQGSAGWQIPGFVLAMTKFGGPPVALVALVCALIVGAKARRRRRRRTTGPPDMRIARGWREALDQARDLGSVVHPGRTRREQARLLDRLPLTSLAAEADATVFGPYALNEQVAEAFWARVDDARRSMTSDLTRWRRWRVALSLRSLRPLRAVAENGGQ